MTNFSKLVLKMTEYEGGCVERVNHFLKVFAFAKTIADADVVRNGGGFQNFFCRIVHVFALCDGLCEIGRAHV